MILKSKNKLLEQYHQAMDTSSRTHKRENSAVLSKSWAVLLTDFPREGRYKRSTIRDEVEVFSDF